MQLHAEYRAASARGHRPAEPSDEFGQDDAGENNVLEKWANAWKIVFEGNFEKNL